MRNIRGANGRWKGIGLLAFLFTTSHLSVGQHSIRELLEMAEKNYPSIAARQAEAQAAYASVALQKNTLLPSLDAAYQANYATFNNITGMNYPATLIPISGPPSTGNTYDAVPGSAASLIFRWSPVTFGQRAASVESSRMQYEKQLAGVEDEVLRVQFRVAFRYLELAAASELILAYGKNIERGRFNLMQVSSLVASGIRPAVDSLRFLAELSRARTELYSLQNLLETHQQELMELLVADQLPTIEVNPLFAQSLPSPAQGSDSVQNPAVRMAQLDQLAREARLAQVKRSWTPRLELWSTAYARGSGISYDGTINKADGWSFSRYNYGAGFQLLFPILDLSNVNLKVKQQRALLQSSESYFNQVVVTLQKEEQLAVNELTTSLQIAGEVPVEYQAHETAYNALQTRYQAGLVDYAELIQAQYDLLNAEARLKTAYINSWKALLKLAVVRGDINIFLNQIPE